MTGDCSFQLRLKHFPDVGVSVGRGVPDGKYLTGSAWLRGDGGRENARTGR